MNKIDLSLSEHLVLSIYGTIRKAIYNLSQLPQKYECYDIEIKLITETEDSNRYQYTICNKKGELKQEGFFLMPKTAQVDKNKLNEGIKKCTTFLFKANGYRVKDDNISILYTMTIDPENIDNESLKIDYRVSERIDNVEGDILWGTLVLDSNDEINSKKIVILQDMLEFYCKQQISTRGEYEQD